MLEVICILQFGGSPRKLEALPLNPGCRFGTYLVPLPRYKRALLIGAINALAILLPG